MAINISISITLDDRDPTHELDQALAAFGFVRAPAAGITSGFRPLSAAVANVVADVTEKHDEGTRIVAETTAPVEPEANTDLPKRERGKPSPGKARRTKEEIAEDEAADAADAATAGSAPAEEPVPEQSVADNADEARDEVNAERPEVGHDHVRAKMKEFMGAYGLEVMTAELTKFFQANWANVTMASEIPDTQEDLYKVIDMLDTAITKNPAGFARVSG